MKGRAEEPGAEQGSLQASVGGIRALLRACSRQHPWNEARAEWRPRPSAGLGLWLLRRGPARKHFLTAVVREEEAQRKCPERMQGDYEGVGPPKPGGESISAGVDRLSHRAGGSTGTLPSGLSQTPSPTTAEQETGHRGQACPPGPRSCP